jgi:signal transduction histidine kinase/DNA-binding response OmpR family regulator
MNAHALAIFVLWGLLSLLPSGLRAVAASDPMQVANTDISTVQNSTVPNKNAERGALMYEVYPTRVYQGGPLNISAQMMPDGRLAVANGLGLLIFDGSTWRLFKHPGELRPFQNFALTPDGRFYGGVPGDFGYFDPEPDGSYVWRSRLDAIPEPSRILKAHTWTHYQPKSDRLIIIGNNVVLSWPRSQSKPTKLEFSGVSASSFKVNNTIWLSNASLGPMYLLDHEPADIKALEGASHLISSLVGVVPHGEDGFVLATSAGRFGHWRDGRFQAIETAQSDRWRRDQLSLLRKLNNDLMVISTPNGAPEIIDMDGRPIATLSELQEAEGSRTADVVDDGEGGIWLTRFGSLIRLDVGSGLTHFGKPANVNSVENIARWQDRLLITDATRIAQLNHAETGQPGVWVELHPRELPNAFLMLPVHDDLFISGSQLHQWRVDQTAPERIADVARASDISFDAAQNLLHILDDKGFSAVDLSEPKLKPVLRYDNRVGANYFLQVSRNEFWLFGASPHAWRLRDSGNGFAQAAPLNLPLPVGARAFVPDSEGRLWAATTGGLHRIDTHSGRVEIPAGLPEPLRSGSVFRAYPDAQGNIYAEVDRQLGVAWKQAGEPERWLWDTTPFAALDPTGRLLALLREANIIWIGRTDGLYRLDLDARWKITPSKTPVLSEIRDSVNNQSLRLDGKQSFPPRFTVNFVLPSLARGGAHRFRSRLKGLETEFSSWSPTHQREFSNLPFGNYTLEVRARDAFGRESVASLLNITIPTPWYRTATAYVVYVALSILALWFAMRLGAYRKQLRLQARQLELETTVAERTHELAERNSELKTQATQLAEQAEQLQEVDRLKTRFFVNVGHEFRTPLTLVLGPVDDLLGDGRERLSQKAREQLELVHRNAKRVLDLIVELLDVNRFEQGQLRLKTETVDLGRLLEKLAQDYSELMQRFGHHLQVRSSDEAIWAAIDPLQLERALGNLLSNAAKFMHRGGVVELSLSTDTHNVVIEVIDHGRGISAQALPHVFDRFYQAEGEDQESGYGIGLSLVREIIEAHQGQITVHSVLGQGTRFQILLPRIEGPLVTLASTESKPVEVSDAAVSEQRRIKVAVIDDHPDLRYRLRGLLQTRYEVIEAEDGPSALQLIRQELPDVVVCDVMMPGYDGVELCKRMRADPELATIGVILLTAKVGSEHAVAGLKAGANDYLAKPFDASELLARVSALLAHAMRLKHRMQIVPDSNLIATLPNGDDKWKLKLEQCIAQRLSDSAFNVEQLASHLHADRTTLFRRCKELLGQGPSEVIREARLKAAQRLFEQGEDNVSEVAYACGFENLSSFARAFKTRFGVTPSQLAKAVESKRA